MNRLPHGRHFERLKGTYRQAGRHLHRQGCQVSGPMLIQSALAAASAPARPLRAPPYGGRASASAVVSSCSARSQGDTAPWRPRARSKSARSASSAPSKSRCTGRPAPVARDAEENPTLLPAPFRPRLRRVDATGWPSGSRKRDDLAETKKAPSGPWQNSPKLGKAGETACLTTSNQQFVMLVGSHSACRDSYRRPLGLASAAGTGTAGPVDVRMWRGPEVRLG